MPELSQLKRFFAIVLLLAFALQFAGIYAYFGLRSFQIRREMRVRLKSRSRNELEQIRLTRDDFAALRVGDDEMRIDDKMYDVAYVESRGDSVIVYALRDHDEDELISFLKSAFKPEKKDKQRVPAGLVKMFTTQYLASTFCIDFGRNGASAPDTGYSLTHYSAYGDHHTPPPKIS